MLFICGCKKSESNITQNSNVAQNIEEAGALTDNSTGQNSVFSNENSNMQVNAQAIGTPDKQQRQKTIDRYIADVAKISDADEYKEARRILYGDLDGDGDEDVAMQFTIESMGGSNNYAFHLAFFRNENGKFTAVTNEVIGGKLRRDITLKKIENGKMYFDTKDYDKDDGACCPSIAGKTVYILEYNKLKEIINKK